MKTVEMWRWWVASETPPGKRIKTRHHMSREDALKRDPTAEPVPGTMELREIAETPEEVMQRGPYPG